jgi:hypothetical protein
MIATPAPIGRIGVVDDRLARLCETWTSSPEHIVSAIRALVGSVGVVETTCL